MTKNLSRIKTTGEIFTAPELVNEIVDEIYNNDPTSFVNSRELFLDPACGDGEFLRGIVRKIKKVRAAFSKKDWEYTIRYRLLGVDLMWDNACDTVYYLISSYDHPRLLEVTTELDPKANLTELSTIEEINNAFECRSYTNDNNSYITIRPQKNSNHYVEYRKTQAGKNEKWIPVENIVRANSLTEWDFENWKPKERPSKDE